MLTFQLNLRYVGDPKVRNQKFLINLKFLINARPFVIRFAKFL